MKTKTKKQLNCPNCDSLLDVDELLISQFEDSIRKDLQSELTEREKLLQKQKDEDLKLSEALKKEKSDIEQKVRDKVQSVLLSKEEQLKDKIRKDVGSEKVKELEDLEKELARKSAQLIELNQTKAKLQRLSRKFEEREAKIHLQKEKELSERLEKAKATMQEQLQMESFLKIKEKENVIESLKQKLEEARQRATRGSVQLQGEAQELLIEEMLRELHPGDEIIEIKKGANGADCIQVVKVNGAIAGKILYESKNTKAWSNSFVPKLKQDNLQTKADIMIIVSKSLPKEMSGKYGLIDNVWITTLENLKDLSLLLKFGLLKTHSVMLSQTDKKDKMSLLYNYLTSDEFRATFESILSGFKNLQESHHDEQRKMQLLWKRRAKHLDTTLTHYVDMDAVMRYRRIKLDGDEEALFKRKITPEEVVDIYKNKKTREG